MFYRNSQIYDIHEKSAEKKTNLYVTFENKKFLKKIYLWNYWS